MNKPWLDAGKACDDAFGREYGSGAHWLKFLQYRAFCRGWDAATLRLMPQHKGLAVLKVEGEATDRLDEANNQHLPSRS